MTLLIASILLGIGATLATDAWAWLRRRLLGVPLPDYGLVGRWFGHMARGQFVHRSIAAAPPVRAELVLGWIAHYAIGIAFAGLLLAGWGMPWLRDPMLGPALLVGIATIAAPWLLMQPAMGVGFASSLGKQPAAARLQSLATHAVFGLGLYLSGQLMNWLLFS